MSQLKRMRYMPGLPNQQLRCKILPQLSNEMVNNFPDHLAPRGKT